MSEMLTEWDRTLHQCRNHLGVILGLATLVLEALPEGDPLRADLAEIEQAAQSALAVVSSVPKEAAHAELLDVAASYDASGGSVEYKQSQVSR